jgi:TDG/mug DNA glycosylase family protein
MPFSPTERPTPRQVAAARGRTIPDVIGPGLKVLFCGINPSLYSAAIGHHFGRPGNRFWPALHAAKITDRLLTPWEDASCSSAAVARPTSSPARRRQMN